MNITKPYGVSGYSFPEHVMPVDLAMHAQISPPVSQLLGMSALRASPPSMSCPDLTRVSPPSPTSSLSSSSSGSSLSSYSPGSGTLRKKKRVVFADTKGLSLVSVRLFTVDPLETESEDATQPEERMKARTPIQSTRLQLKLGFPQPAAERASLKDTLVQLESCSLADRALSGTVRVRNLRFDKTVFIRITFDSWRSYKDIPCTYVREAHATLETDLFTFKIPFPSDLNQKERLEFKVVFRPGNNNLQFVDNNKGKNYQINMENMPPEPRILTSEPRMMAPEPRMLPSEPRMLAPEPRMLAPEPRLVAPEPNFLVPEPRMLAAESRLLVTEHRKVVPEPRPSRRNFVTPSPQRLSAWPGVKGQDLNRMKNLACKGPPYTDRLVNRNWARMTNAVPLC